MGGNLMKYTPRLTSDAMIAPKEAKPVSLAPMPFEIPPADGDETKPRLAPIRGEIGPNDKRWLRSMERGAR